MADCHACGKTYASLEKHHARQPMCAEWLALSPGLAKRFVDGREGKFDDWARTECPGCKQMYSNVGNLNKHLDKSTCCRKWRMYAELKGIDDFQPAYSEPAKHAEVAPQDPHARYAMHIIWNLFLTDRDSVEAAELATMLSGLRIRHVVAMLPEEGGAEVEGVKVREAVAAVEAAAAAEGVGVREMRYADHASAGDRDGLGAAFGVDLGAYDETCDFIEAARAARENVLIFCNNGYQRSVPFLCHLLTTRHADEVPNVAKAVDLVLPQVDRQNYARLRDETIDKVTAVLNRAPRIT